MIVFYLANSIDEAESASDYLLFDEKIHAELERKRDLPAGIDFIAELDPYDDRLLEKNEIEKVLVDIKNFIPECKDDDYKTFFNKLLQLCEKALEDNKLIFALGD